MSRSNNLTITERELIQRLALITGYTEQVVRDVIKAQTEFVLDEIENDTPVRIGNIGELYISTRQHRTGYDFINKCVHEGTKTTKVIKFRPSLALKKAAKSS